MALWETKFQRTGLVLDNIRREELAATLMEREYNTGSRLDYNTI